MTIHAVAALSRVNHTRFQGGKLPISRVALDRGASPFVIGLLYTTYSMFPMLLAAYWGTRADRIGRRGPHAARHARTRGGPRRAPWVFPGLAGLFVSAVTIGLTDIFSVVSVQALIGLSASRIGVAIATYAAAMFAIRFATPTLVRRLGEEGVLRLSMLVAVVIC